MNMAMKIIVVCAVLAAAAGVVVLKNCEIVTPGQRALATQSIAEVQTGVPGISPDDEPQSVPASLPQLVDLGATTCIPCKAMAPILDALREDFAGQFEVTFIDVWQNRAAGEAYGVKLIPTQIFIDAEGNELFRHEGFYSREAILAKWVELGVAIEMPANTGAGT